MSVSPPPRRRVTAPRARVSAPAGRQLDEPLPDASAVYLRTLIRAQLRLAIALAVAFALTLATASVVIAMLPVLHETTVFGVPWSWVLQAYGMYPLVAVFALIAVRAASRNEQRYRALEPRA